MRRKLISTVAALALGAAPVALIGPAAQADPAGCTLQYVSGVTNPPENTQVIYIENNKFEIEEVSVRPGEVGVLVDYVTGQTVAYVTCVV